MCFCIGGQFGAPDGENIMDGIFNFLRSDLFLSLFGGFALGVAGLALIKPASAGDVTVEASQAITIGYAPHGTVYHAP
ncbi:MAG: hypothetical protein B7Y00_02885 [Sphingomonadales bacterium 17-56-6]|nr:MAG: hypothetical protein B7Y00_02885 [Sphingomonadales bacterium 17-56-6]